MSILKSILKWIVYAAILLIIVAICVIFGWIGAAGALTIGSLTFTGSTMLLVGGGTLMTAFLIDDEVAVEAVADVQNAVGETVKAVTSTVTGAAAAAAGGVAAGLFSHPITWILLGVFLFFLLRDKKTKVGDYYIGESSIGKEYHGKL